MSWKDELLPASFRNVPFHIERAETRVGRRTEKIEFPDRDVGIMQDNGLLMRGFTLEAFVIGDNYLADKDDLVTALEKAGAGTLVHPYWGSFSAVVDGDVVIRESNEDGGVARMSIRFIKTGTESSTPSRSSTEDVLRAKCDLAILGAIAGLEATFNLLDVINAAINAAFDAIDAVVGIIEDAVAFVQGIFDTIDAVIAAVEAVKAIAEELINLPQELVAKFANKLSALVGSVFQIVGSDETAAVDEATTVELSYDTPDRVEVLAALVERMTTAPTTPIPTQDITPALQIELDNRAALETFVQAVSVIEAARASSYLAYDSYDQASGLRDDVVAAIDAVLLKADDLTYASLVAVRASLISHLAAAATALPRLVEFTPSATVPSLALAYRLYGDAEREAEIVRRNKIAHPGMVPGGVALQVVSRG
jgi:prophage DNA circulation protein